MDLRYMFTGVWRNTEDCDFGGVVQFCLRLLIWLGMCVTLTSGLQLVIGLATLDYVWGWFSFVGLTWE